MPATFKIVLSHKPDANGLTDVRLRITQNRVPRYMNLGIAIDSRHWNEKGTEIKANWFRTSDHNHAQHNEECVTWLKRARDLAKAHPHLTTEEIKARLQLPADLQPDTPDLVAYFRMQLEEDRRRYSTGTLEVRAGAVNDFATFTSGVLPVTQVKLATMRDFDLWLKARGNGPGTRNKKMKVMRLYCKRALRDELLVAHPMAGFEMAADRPSRLAYKKLTR